MPNTKLIKKKRVVRDRVKTAAVYWVSQNFNCTTAFVYASIRGDYTTGISDEVVTAFNQKYDALKQALNA